MKKLFFVTAFFWLLLVSRAQAEELVLSQNEVVTLRLTTPLRVVPGKSAGKIWLGAKRETVRRILGKPSVVTKFTSDMVCDAWYGDVAKDDMTARKRAASNLPAILRFAVIYENNRAVQIEFNTPHFRTDKGISTRSSLAQFRKSYRPFLRSFLYADPEGGGGSRAYIYDDVRRGIAFTFGGQDRYDARVLPERLRIHRRGVRAIPDPGGVRKNYRDEVPVGQGAL